MKVVNILFVALLTNLPLAHAEGWAPRLSCDGGALVVDGNYSLENGVTDHQLVIRDTSIQSYLQTLVNKPLALNENNEMIVQGLGRKFDGNLSAELARDYREGSGSLIYTLNGHWLDGGRYEIYLTSRWCGPGSCQPSEGKYLGKWVLNDCRKMN